MAAVVALESLLATQTLWHAGRAAAIVADGVPTGYSDLDALLPQVRRANSRRFSSTLSDG